MACLSPALPTATTPSVRSNASRIHSSYSGHAPTSSLSHGEAFRPGGPYGRSCLQGPKRVSQREAFGLQTQRDPGQRLAGRQRQQAQGFRDRVWVHRGGVRAQAGRVRFSATLTTDIPFRERYGVSFEEYLTKRDRVFAAFFPDKKRCERLNGDEWRIYMLPLDFFFLSVRPVVDMRLALSSPVSPNGTQLLSLQATKCDLRGVDVHPSDFVLGVDGALYAEREQHRGGTRLRGQMGLTVDLAVTDSLGLLPPATVEAVGSALLNQVLENMKDRVNSRVLEDYASYAWEQAQAVKQRAK